MKFDNKTLKQIDDEAGIDESLVEWVDRATNDELLHEDDFKVWNHEMSEELARDITQLAEIAENMNEADLAVIIGVALTKHPLLVFQVIAEFVIDLMKRRER